MQPEQSGARPLNVLFLCTHNSSRSQIAEAIMTRKVERLAFGRFRVASAGSTPADSVNGGALRALQRFGIDWSGHRPKSIDEVSERRWDSLLPFAIAQGNVSTHAGPTGVCALGVG